MDNETAKALAEKVRPNEEKGLIWSAYDEKPYQIELSQRTKDCFYEGDSWEEVFAQFGVEVCVFCNGEGKIVQGKSWLTLCGQCEGRGYRLTKGEK